eukprot:266292-Pelagomonas_calceolata.AAC.1
MSKNLCLTAIQQACVNFGKTRATIICDIAVPAYIGSLVEAKKVHVTKPVRAGGQEQNISVSYSISGMLTL